MFGLLFALAPCVCGSALPRVLEIIPEYCISSRWGFSCFEARAGPLARLGALHVRQMVGRSVLATAGLVVGREILRDCAENKRLLRQTRGLAGIEGIAASVVLGRADDEPAPPAAEVTDEPSPSVESSMEPDVPMPFTADPQDTAAADPDEQQRAANDETEAAGATSADIHNAAASADVDVGTSTFEATPGLDQPATAQKRPFEARPRGRRRAALRAAAWDPGWE